MDGGRIDFENYFEVELHVDRRDRVYIGGPMGVFGTSTEDWQRALHRYGAMADRLEADGFDPLPPHEEEFGARYPSAEQIEAGLTGDKQLTSAEIFLHDFDLITSCEFGLMFLDKVSTGVGAEIAIMLYEQVIPFLIVFEGDGASYYSKFIEGFLEDAIPEFCDDLVIRVQTSWPQDQMLDYVLVEFSSRIEKWRDQGLLDE